MVTPVLEETIHHSSNAPSIADDQLIHDELQHLHTAIEFLAKNSNLSLDTLPNSHPVYQAFETVKLGTALLYDTPHFTTITNFIDHLPQPKTIVPGTVGAFLFGCRQTSYGDVSRLCSPLCIQNIPVDPNTYRNQEQLSYCPYQVWAIKNHKLVPLNQSDTNRAYIYVNPDFTGFTDDDLKTLKDHGIKLAQVLKNHTTIIPMTDVDQLLQTSPSSPSWASSSPKTCNNYYWLIIILIVGIIIAILYFYPLKWP